MRLFEIVREAICEAVYEAISNAIAIAAVVEGSIQIADASRKTHLACAFLEVRESTNY